MGAVYGTNGDAGSPLHNMVMAQAAAMGGGAAGPAAPPPIGAAPGFGKLSLSPEQDANLKAAYEAGGSMDLLSGLESQYMQQNAARQSTLQNAWQTYTSQAMDLAGSNPDPAALDALTGAYGAQYGAFQKPKFADNLDSLANSLYPDQGASPLYQDPNAAPGSTSGIFTPDDLSGIAKQAQGYASQGTPLDQARAQYMVLLRQGGQYSDAELAKAYDAFGHGYASMPGAAIGTTPITTADRAALPAQQDTISRVLPALHAGGFTDQGLSGLSQLGQQAGAQWGLGAQQALSQQNSGIDPAILAAIAKLQTNPLG